VHGHYGPAGGPPPSRGRGAEVALKYGGDVVAGGKARGGKDAAEPEQDEDEAQLDPEILALIEKEVGGNGGGVYHTWRKLRARCPLACVVWFVWGV